MIEEKKVFKNSQAYYFAGIKVLNYRPEDVIKDVADYFKISVEDLTGRSRQRRFVMPRQIVSYFIRDKFPMFTTIETGKIIGGFDHSSIVHNVATVKRDMQTSQLFKDTIMEIREIIEGHILNKEQVGKIEG